ncbi:MAG: hypothetical protein ACOCWF_08140, partial [Halochromatium sp.]
ETADGESWIIDDLVFDDRDWALAYLDLTIGEPSADAGAGAGAGAEAAADQDAREPQCLVPTQSIDWLDPQEQTLHLAVGARELRTAPAMPSPVAFDGRSRVRVYEPA